MAGREEKLTSVNPLHRVAENVGFIGGVRGSPQHLPLRPPEQEKTREEPYLAADLAGEIRRPTPIYWHLATPRPEAGKTRTPTPRLQPEPRLHLLQTASPPARASVRVAVVDSQRDGREGEPSGEGEKE
jgi:hypothetical protein